MSSIYSDKTNTQRKYQALGIDFLDQTIISLTVSITKTFTSVTWIANQLQYSRTSISTRLSKLVNLGWLHREKLSGQSVKYTLTQKAYDTIARFIQRKTEELRARKKKAVKQAKEVKQAVQLQNQGIAQEQQEAAQSQPEQPKPANKPIDKRQQLLDYFKTDPDTKNVPDQVKADAIHDYMDWIEEDTNRSVTRGGCRKRIQANYISYLNGISAKNRAMKLDQLKAERGEAIERKFKAGTDNIMSDLKNTAEKLTDRKWADEPSPLDMIDQLSDEPAF